MSNKRQSHCKTRKLCRKHNSDSKHIDAKKGTQMKCLMKTCRAKKYNAIYGSSGGNIRSNRGLFG